jgi:hypothetical protein
LPKLAKIKRATRWDRPDVYYCLCVFFAYMKKIYTTAKPQRSFRRFIKQAFISLLKRQNSPQEAQIQKLMAMLRSIENTIEIMAQEMERRTERGK